MRVRMRVTLFKRQLREWLFFDSPISKACIGIAGLVIGSVQLALGRRQSGVETLSRTHRADVLPIADRLIERLFRLALAGGTGRFATEIRTALREYPDQVVETPQTARFFESPRRLLNGCIIVLKSPSDNERGVIYLYYSYVYALFMRFFDAPAIAERYHLVVEPSWSGFCEQNILALSALRKPIFVGSIEPRDTAFLRAVGGNFVPVAIGGNTWVDPTVFTKLPDVRKEYDIVVISGWAPYKRHWAFFRALREMKRTGRHPRVALVGYAIEATRAAIVDEARYFGVDTLIEIHERLTPVQVNLVLNRSKVNLLWSRREGVNRGIIEGMAADVPCVVRQGFNYGHHYPYINDQTGCFATEAELPRVLARMIDEHASFAPRAWMLSRMTPDASTAVLHTAVKAVATERGETWTRDVAVKVSTLDGLAYWHPEDRQRFDADYQFLESTIRV